MALSSGVGDSLLRGQSYKLITLDGRMPGANESFQFRYIAKGPTGERVSGKRSASINFSNIGLSNKYNEAPTLSLKSQAIGYIASWSPIDPTKYPNYVYTEIYESKTLSTVATFNEAALSTEAVTYIDTATSNSYSVITGTDLALRYVRVRHVGLSNGVYVRSPLSNIASVTPTTPDAADVTPPGNPTGFTVTAFNDQTDRSGQNGYVIATWTAPADTDVEGYYIRWGSNQSELINYNFYSFSTGQGRINNLRAGTTYYFQIASTDGSNQSDYVPSPPVSATIPGDTTAPAAPSGLVAVAGFNNVIAYWNRNTEGDVDLGRGTYQFQLSTVNTFASVLQDRTITGTVASFTGLTTGTTYYVRVRAIDSTGNQSPWSAVASATPGKINAELAITSGTIVGDLVAANTLVGDKIIGNTIDADKLKTNTGIVGKLFVGDDSGANKITIDGTATTPAVYYGVGNYNNADTPFYFDALGKFSLKDQLTWNGSSLNIKGSLNVTQASTFSANVSVTSGGAILIGGTGANRVSITDEGIFKYVDNNLKFALYGNSSVISLSIGSMLFGENVSGTNDGIKMANRNYWYDDGTFSLGTSAESILDYNPSLQRLTFSLQPYDGDTTTSSKVYVSGIRSNLDGTANDPTLVVARDGQMTIGRTLYWGGSKGDPNVSPGNTTTNFDKSVAGDLYFTTVS